MATPALAFYTQSDLTGSFDKANFSARLHSLHQTDFEPLRCRAQATPVMTVQVQAASAQSFYTGAYLNNVKLTYAGGNSGSFTAPTTNPRIDDLSMNASNVLVITQGTEAASPVAPATPAGNFPIAQIFLRVGMTTIVDRENSGANPTQGYVYADIRPKMVAGGVTAHSALTGLTTGDDHTQYAKLAGRAAGQTLQGGTAASENLNLESTAHATKGTVVIKGGRLKFEDAAADPTADGQLFRNGVNYKFHDGTAVRTLVHSNTTAGGDLSGTYPNPVVAKIQARAMAATAPNTDEVIGWDGSTWKPVVPSGAWKFVEALDLAVSGVSATLPTDADEFMLIFEHCDPVSELTMRFNSDNGGNYTRVYMSTATVTRDTAVTEMTLGNGIINGAVYFSRILSASMITVGMALGGDTKWGMAGKWAGAGNATVVNIVDTGGAGTGGKVFIWKHAKT